MTKNSTLTDENFFAAEIPESSIWDTDEVEGQLAVDVYQTKNDVVVKAPVAGVDPDGLDVVVTNDSISIRGERHDEVEVDEDGYHFQECYWGSFARTVALPVECDSEKADASFKKGILTIRIPKTKKLSSNKLKIKSA